MPHANIYIRDDDWKAYMDLKTAGEWPEWLHKALQKSTEPPIDVPHVVIRAPEIVHHIPDAEDEPYQ